MHGKIYFDDIEQMVEFLTEFCGKSTAIFEARPAKMNEHGTWVIEFGGGY